MSTRVDLVVPPLGCLFDDVFDAWSWCESDVLEWRRPNRELERGSIDGTNPGDLVFVVRDGVDASFLPRELARLHAVGYDLRDEWALAPYAIDDATDLLYERRVRPRAVLWLAAASLPALVWGLHDWVHFHNHGPFEEPAMTELQCDLVALEWLRLNRALIGLDEGEVDGVAKNLATLATRRFAEEGSSPPCDLDAIFSRRYPSGVAKRRVKNA
jgi:hypothetical protein